MQKYDEQYRRVEGTHTGAPSDTTEPNGRKTADTVYQAATVVAAVLLVASAAFTMI